MEYREFTGKTVEDAVMEAADRVREQDRTALQGCILTHDEFSISNMVLY